MPRIVLAFNPAIEPTMITLPPPRSAMPGMTRLENQRLDLTFEAMTLSKISSLNPESGP